MNTTGSNLPALFRPVVAQRPSLAGDGYAEPVLSLLGERGWALVDTPEANVHCTSPDGRVYVGWLPEDRTAWRRGIVWTVRAAPTEGEPWVQEFGPDVPSRAVAGFLEALTGHADR
ncbi:DUF317 domain-containing protein [Actinacidiphila paucisporea]|uniref:DUF317 domain-containing protein n=1 Tax=Actinacidiphila paucisporea TaxID=310782 RepID=A0A1M7PZK3_9ACTN|nr:DUF317 domain-containing protein [Actinacidiphila paucisporea]SHN23215.1 protein of unknown function [Actinacidiphila paucisporea]